MRITLAVVLAALAAGAPAAAADPGRAPLRFDAPEADARAAAVRADVARDLTALGSHPWAGRYYWGDGLGANVSLELSPGAGFVFEWHGCLGLYGRNYGRVTDTGTRVVLAPELANAPGTFSGIDEDFVPVSWGERRYLVASARMDAFCKAVKEGLEPRAGPHGLFLLRRGDEAKGAPGRPRNLQGDVACPPAPTRAARRPRN